MTTTEFISCVRTERNRMLLTASQWLQAEEDAEDAVQEVLLKLWEARGRLTTPEDFHKYSAIAVRNTALNILRTQRHQHTTLPPEENVLPVHSPTADRELEEAEERRIMRTIISRLPASHKAMLNMRNVRQMSYGEIASILGITEAAVRMRVSRIRRQLVEQIRKSFTL